MAGEEVAFIVKLSKETERILDPRKTGSFVKEFEKMMKKYKVSDNRGGGGSGGGGGGSTAGDRFARAHSEAIDMMNQKLANDRDLILLDSQEKRARSDILNKYRTEQKNLAAQIWQQQEYTRALGRITRGMVGGLVGNQIGSGVAMMGDVARMGIGGAMNNKKGKFGGLMQYLTDPEQASKDRGDFKSPVGGMGAGGTGGNLSRIMESSFGKAMTKHTSKMSKFMGSKAGMGVMGGMAGGLGIAGGIITKAIEASPIAQSMVKIMKTAFTLILRPIGDFFGGFMKPIAIRLIKFGADSQKEAQNLFRIGEKVGIATLAFFTKPAEAFGLLAERIGATIGIELRGWFDEGFDKAAAYEKLFVGFDEKMAEIAEVAQSTESIVSQASTNVRSGLDTSMLENTNKVIDEVVLLEEEVEDLITEVGETGAIVTAVEKGNTLATGFVRNYEAMQSQQTKNITSMNDPLHFLTMSEEIEQTYINDKKEMYDKSVTSLFGIEVDASQRMGGIMDGIYRGFEDFVGFFTGTVDKFEESTDKAVKNFDTAATSASLNLINVQQQNLKDAVNEWAPTAQSLGLPFLPSSGAQATIGGQTIANTSYFSGTGMGFGSDYKATTIGLMEAGVWQGVGQSSGKPSHNLSTYQSGGYDNDNSAHGLAVGGIITEPIKGIGLMSGKGYMLGEAGAELVTPMSRAGSGMGNVVVNINIAKVSSDVDLNQIKPIIERALHESHSRRGLI